MNGHTRADENADATDSSTVEQLFSGVIGVEWVTSSCLDKAANDVAPCLSFLHKQLFYRGLGHHSSL
uniref:Transposase n=1 Tax=Angiostrongylus cantonensis TaxID=6313 RepID=A0A0K0CZP4_ANGCA